MKSIANIDIIFKKNEIYCIFNIFFFNYENHFIFKFGSFGTSNK